MIKKIKNVLLTLITPLVLAAPFAVAAPVHAEPLGECRGANGIQQSVSQGINSATTGSGSCDGVKDGEGPGSLQEVAQTVVNFLSVIVGIIAVIMIIIGGFKYITSGGDSGNVSGAKNTLIYAIVGLIIVALAQFIVKFVLDNVTG